MWGVVVQWGSGCGPSGVGGLTTIRSTTCGDVRSRIMHVHVCAVHVHVREHKLLHVKP